MKVICTHCKKETEFKLNDLDRAMVFSMLFENKELMQELGKQAAKAFLQPIEKGKK